MEYVGRLRLSRSRIGLLWPTKDLGGVGKLELW
jgi:hypothetical protein